MNQGSTNVPSIAFGPVGPVAPPESAVLTGTLADIVAAFGGVPSRTLTTPQGQIASSEAAMIGDLYAQIIYMMTQCDPAFAQGRQQDGIGRIYFMSRIPATATIASVTIVGGTSSAPLTITAGVSQIMAADGNIYTATNTVDGINGSAVIPFSCNVTGPIACPAQQFTIYTTTNNWNTAISNAAGVPGSLVESQQAFELRRQQSVAVNANQVLAAITANVLAVPGVTDVFTAENDLGSVQTIGGVALNANSIYVCVNGGASTDIGYAIIQKKGPGCGYTGNTTVTVRDTNPIYAPSYPSYSVTYETPSFVPIYFAVSIANSSAVPSTALSSIQNAVLAAYAGTSGGARATIGSEIFASRCYAGIASLGAWAKIISIFIGTAGSPTGTTVQMNINQMPTFQASNIALTLV